VYQWWGRRSPSINSGEFKMSKRRFVLVGASMVAMVSMTVFGLQIASASSITGYGKVHGQVLLGPTCPVERIPPDLACAPKPYKTSIQIFAAKISSHPYKTVVTDAKGKFYFSIKPGSYVLHAKGGAFYPRCADLRIKVSTGKTLNLKMACDTGLR
jgi:hypothetical protein